jgi:hypothetical protein
VSTRASASARRLRAGDKRYKLITDIPVVCWSSKPHLFAYVGHTFLVGAKVVIPAGFEMGAATFATGAAGATI